MVEGAALEKRWAMSPVGSNPTLSAEHGEVLEWPIRRAWRARVAFGDRGFESHPLRHFRERSSSLSSMVCHPILDAKLEFLILQ